MKNFKKMVLILMFPCAVIAKEKAFEINSLSDLDKCTSQYSYDTGNCFEPLQKFVKKHPKEAWLVGEKAVRAFAHWTALEFFLLDKTAASKCTNKSFQMALSSALSLPTDQKERKVAVQFLEKKNCLKEMSTYLKSELADPTNSPLRDAVCPVFQKNGIEVTDCVTKKESTVATAEKETLPTISKDKISLTDNVKVYSGPEGEKMWIAQINGTELYLVKFLKVKGPWNNKILVHKMHTNGPYSSDLWTENAGSRWVTIATRQSQNTVTLPGQKELPFYYSEVESKSASAKNLLGEFKKQ